MFRISFEDLARSSLRSILKNKSRTLLTSLGIIIGVTSVILLTSIGTGLQSYITDQFDKLGANSVFIAPGKIFNDKGGFSNSGNGRFVATSFTLNDVSQIKRNLRSSLVVPVSVTIVDAKSSNKSKTGINLIGTTYQFGSASNRLPKEGNGRWFTKEEEDKGSNVIVLGYSIATDLFPNSNALGKRVIVKSQNLKVVGVMEKQGSSFGGPDADNQAYTPISNVHNINGNQNIAQILIKTPSKDQVDSIKKQTEKLLLKKYDKDAFTVFDSSQLLSSINAIIGTLTIGLAGIAAISLIVGGIGIMNIMLVTVTERTKEIGLRKAIGATPNAILLQFLIEAVVLAGVGGLTGILLGGLGTLAINSFFPAKITLESIMIAFGVSSIVGIIFGVVPARKASKLSPIEALRYE